MNVGVTIVKLLNTIYNAVATRHTNCTFSTLVRSFADNKFTSSKVLVEIIIPIPLKYNIFVYLRLKYLQPVKLNSHY